MEKVKERKIKDFDNANKWIDDYMSDKQDIKQSDYFKFLRYIVETIKMWKQVKAVRNKIYAHQDVLNDKVRYEIENVGYSQIEEIIQRLFTLEHILLEAFYNGSAPDFNFRNTATKVRVQKEISSLLSRLSGT